LSPEGFTFGPRSLSGCLKVPVVEKSFFSHKGYPLLIVWKTLPTKWGSRRGPTGPWRGTTILGRRFSSPKTQSRPRMPASRISTHSGIFAAWRPCERRALHLSKKETQVDPQRNPSDRVFALARLAGMYAAINGLRPQSTPVSAAGQNARIARVALPIYQGTLTKRSLQKCAAVSPNIAARRSNVRAGVHEGRAQHDICRSSHPKPSAVRFSALAASCGVSDPHRTVRLPREPPGAMRRRRLPRQQPSVRGLDVSVISLT